MWVCVPVSADQHCWAPVAASPVPADVNVVTLPAPQPVAGMSAMPVKTGKQPERKRLYIVACKWNKTSDCDWLQWISLNPTWSWTWPLWYRTYNLTANLRGATSFVIQSGHTCSSTDCALSECLFGTRTQLWNHSKVTWSEWLICLLSSKSTLTQKSQANWLWGGTATSVPLHPISSWNHPRGRLVLPAVVQCQPGPESTLSAAPLRVSGSAPGNARPSLQLLSAADAPKTDRQSGA